MAHRVYRLDTGPVHGPLASACVREVLGGRRSTAGTELKAAQPKPREIVAAHRELDRLPIAAESSGSTSSPSCLAWLSSSHVWPTKYTASSWLAKYWWKPTLQ